MSAVAERGFQPPRPQGEPFRADPADPAPFLTEDDKVPVVPVESSPYFPEPAAPFGHPPSHSPEYGGAGAGQGPVFQRPSARTPAPASPVKPEERFARTAFWVGIASIFVFNIVIGPIAMIMGAMAMRRGEKRLGGLAMTFGAIGTFIGVLLLVLVGMGILPSVDEMLKDIRNGR